MKKQAVHFTDTYLLQPTNPVTVNVIGAGGTGSQVLTGLARISHSLMALNHPGLQVRVFDDDVVSKANLGRQLFSPSEVGLNKGVALVNRINRFYGFNWKAVAIRFAPSTVTGNNKYDATLTISCVDTVAARFSIADILKGTTGSVRRRNSPLYWCDFGNGQHTGQVVLSTVREIEQPPSKKFAAISQLPFVTDEYRELLQQTDETTLPSCSLAEALTKQDLFINSSLANMGCSLIWQLFREGMITNRGFFINLKEFRTQPIKII